MINRLKNAKSMQKISFKKIIQYSLIATLLFGCMCTFAAEGTDLLADTEKDLIKTITGTGKTYLYIAELIFASVGFIKSRNPTVFLGILALSVGFNVLLKIAGVA